MMKRFVDRYDAILIWLFFLLGLWLAVIGPLGPALSRVPGDLGDSRFNNYILEHFFRWVWGLDKNYWSATFLYPYPQVVAFSDNLLGSAFIYACFRALGLDMLTAFQGWYIAGFCLNYLASAYVLRRLKFTSLGIAAGAFFFTFGLPVLAQEYHVQLVYRFGVPLACYFMWSFYEQPRLRTLVLLAFWLVWQFYLTIYVGILLTMLLIVLAALLPFCFPATSFQARLTGWPQRLGLAWSEAARIQRVAWISAGAALAAGLAFLLWPYYAATRLYGLSRGLPEIMSMLPQPQSYLTESRDMLWNALAGPVLNPLLSYLPALPNPHEHQLFPGISILILLVAGLVLSWPTHNNALARLNLGALVVLGLLTLRLNDFSLYTYVARLPGLNSIRAVTRIDLVMMWPLSIFIAWAIGAWLSKTGGRLAWTLAVYMLLGLLVLESGLYDHATFTKADALARLTALRQELPNTVPNQPILFVAEDRSEPPSYSELDAMLVAQQLGWPTMNGYTGNYPSADLPSRACNRFATEIDSYMQFADITSRIPYYLRLSRRLVPVGFGTCPVARSGNYP